MFPDGNTVLVSLLLEGQRARVLQLPAAARDGDAAPPPLRTSAKWPSRSLYPPQRPQSECRMIAVLSASPIRGIIMTS